MSFALKDLLLIMSIKFVLVISCYKLDVQFFIEPLEEESLKMGFLDLCKKEEYTFKEIVCSYSVFVFSFPP